MEERIGGIGECKPLPWGLWATIGLTILIIVIAVMAQTVIVVAFVVVALICDPTVDLHLLGSNGLLLAVATCVTAPIAIAASLLFARLRNSLTIRDYLCLCRPGKRQYFKWLVSLLLLCVASDGLSVLLDEPIVGKFMIDAYKTAGFAPFFWLSLIVAAPLGEEVVFRGFMFRGIENSRIGGVGAILISSLLWACLHIQYNLFEIGLVFVTGLLLGVARLRSRSLYIPIMMHATMNLMATIETAVYLRMFSE